VWVAAVRCQRWRVVVRRHRLQSVDLIIVSRFVFCGVGENVTRIFVEMTFDSL
jgi:hypothetical protein